ncbi:hypothetical protein Q2941_11390 [Bradyrhizobium sp. UFLA05-153]
MTIIELCETYCALEVQITRLRRRSVPAIGGAFLGMLVGFYAQEEETWSRQAMTGASLY